MWLPTIVENRLHLPEVKANIVLGLVFFVKLINYFGPQVPWRSCRWCGCPLYAPTSVTFFSMYLSHRVNWFGNVSRRTGIACSVYCQQSPAISEWEFSHASGSGFCLTILQFGPTVWGGEKEKLNHGTRFKYGRIWCPSAVSATPRFSRPTTQSRVQHIRKRTEQSEVDRNNRKQFYIDDSIYLQIGYI